MKRTKPFWVPNEIMAVLIRVVRWIKNPFLKA